MNNTHKFINRKEELAALNEKWEEKKSQLFIIYGKRRVGKTELIKQFIKDKPAIYFLADKRNMGDQLKELGRIAGEYFNDSILAKRGFGDWLEFFEYLKKNSPGKFVFVIDEYPYLIESDGWLSSVFQKGWDQYLKESNIFLILSGSSVAMMEAQTLVYKSPLYGRRTGQLLLKPLSFSQSWEFFPGKEFGEFLKTYAVTGGMPAYLLQFDPKISCHENIAKKVFARTEYMHNEVEFILKEELREPKNYLAILKAIAWGKTKLGDIVNETGLDKGLVNKYLGTLSQLQLVARQVSVTEPVPLKSRKGLYKIDDNFVRFWFQYIFPYKSELELGQYEEPLKKLKDNFSVLEAIAYEDVCRQLIWNFKKNFFPFQRVGKWWDKNEEIDIVAINPLSKEILFGEAKWSNKQVGINIYESLKKKSRLVDWNFGERKEHFALFSKSGFTPDMIALAKKDNIQLIHGQDLIL